MKAPELEWIEADLATVDIGRQFDVVVMAGNVMIFVEPSTEAAVVANMARHVAPGGHLIAGFRWAGRSGSTPTTPRRPAGLERRRAASARGRALRGRRGATSPSASTAHLPGSDPPPAACDAWPMSEHGEIQITCGSDDEASAIGHRLVEQRLAACVQSIPIGSVYEWDGAIHDDREVLLLVKTRADRFDDVAQVVDELHSYELPAVTMVPITGTRSYLEWIDRQVGEAAD